MPRVSARRIPLTGIALPDASTGAVLDLGTLPGRHLLTAIRHRYCLLCQEHLVQVQQAARDAGIDVLAVGFSPAPALAALADHLGWTGAFLVDTDREVYQRLGLDRAPLWRTYSIGTLKRYAVAATEGIRMPRPVEDIQQLGGDALLQDGFVVRRWLPRTPNDRVDPTGLLAAAESL